MGGEKGNVTMPEQVEKPADFPDMSIPNRILESYLRARGLEVRVEEKVLHTGIPGFRLERGETQVLTAEGLPRVFGHLEINAHLDHACYGSHLISDLVSLDAESPEALLTECAETYTRLTLDPLLALFDEAALASPQAVGEGIGRDGQAVLWHVLAGQTEIRGADAEQLAPFLQRTPPMGYVAGSLAGILGRAPRLHWCKLYAERANGELTTGVVIDSRHKSSAAERELTANLSPQAVGGDDWSLREFALFVPMGPMPEDQATAFRAEAVAVGALPERPSWWPWAKTKPLLRLSTPTVHGPEQ
jgi:hypothetical protein